MTSATPPLRAARPLACARGSDVGFTLLEVLVVTAIVAVGLSIASLTFRKLGEANRLTTAANTLTQFAAVARVYAMDQSIETLLVVNNTNGRLELWHANPPVGPGSWDPLSSGDGTLAPPPGEDRPSRTNGFAYAPVLDSTASMPLASDGRPLVVVHPIDYDAVIDAAGTPLRGTALAQANHDNLVWPALCFDADGQLIQVARRIATRLPTDYQGNAVPPDQTNRRSDGTPDAGRLMGVAGVTEATKYVVDFRDSPITATPGFVVSDRGKFEEVLTTPTPTTFDLVNVWLARARLYPTFVRYVVINPWSGRELAAVQ